MSKSWDGRLVGEEMPHEFKKGKFMVKTAFELCKGFYNYMKQNGYNYCSVEKYQNSLQVKSLKSAKFKDTKYFQN